MGVLGNQLYTMIVAMAVVTTMIMPPTLRWVLARVPLREEETKRLEKEDAEEREFVPKMERALVYLDDGPNGRLVALLAGMFAARQQVLTTIMELGAGHEVKTDPGRQLFAEAAALALDRIPRPSDAAPFGAAVVFARACA
jgi:K+:H+ antiporter